MPTKKHQKNYGFYFKTILIERRENAMKNISFADLLCDISPTNEQKLFIKSVQSGKNIFVDACVGSGKTTAIQNTQKSSGHDL